MIRDELYKLDSKEAYNFLKSAIAEGSVDKEEANRILRKVRRGLRIDFDIRLYFDNLIEYIQKSNMFMIGSKLYKYSDVMDEIENRETIIKEFLFENLEDKSVV